MNLLIFGAGSQGPVVKEIAQAIGAFSSIAFLDDNRNNPLSLAPLDDFRHYLGKFPIAIPSFGDCLLRSKWLDRLEDAGFIIPTLIHPMATISPSAVIDAGSTVEMKAVVSTNARIGRGCIISSSAVVDSNSTVNRYCHIASSATIKKSAVVPDYSVIPSGMVFG